MRLDEFEDIDDVILYKLGVIQATLEQQNGLMIGLANRSDSIDRRVSSLEQIKNWGVGAAAVIGVIFTLITNWLIRGHT